MESSIANAADYADAMLTARKAKNILVFILLLMILFQLGFFFATRYKLQIGSSALIEPGQAPTPAVLVDFLKYVVGTIDFLGVVVPIVLAVDLLLIVSIMLIGRLLGVCRLVSAFLWCVVLMALLFPWQAFLMNQTFTSTEFKIPGVLYTWSEIATRGRIHPAGPVLSLLFWARFVGWPVVATLLLLTVQHQSRVGIRTALGESLPAAGGHSGGTTT